LDKVPGLAAVKVASLLSFDRKDVALSRQKPKRLRFHEFPTQHYSFEGNALIL